MPEPRAHRALVTAPFRGPGLDALREIADVVLDPWIDQQPLRIYDADALAERITSEGADLLVVESDSVRGPVLDLPLVAIGSCRGDPTNVDVPAATAKGIPVLRAPGRNADAVAEMAVGLLFAVTRGIPRADLDVRAGETYRDGTIPYQRFRAWQLAGQTAGIVGYGAVGRAAAWRFAGLGMEVISYDPFAPDATHSLDDLLAEADVVSMHAAVTPESLGMIGTDQFAAHARRARGTSTPPAPGCTTPTRSSPRSSRATSAAPASTTSTVSTCPSTTRCARWPTSCSPRTSAARPTTPRRITPR